MKTYFKIVAGFFLLFLLLPSLARTQVFTPQIESPFTGHSTQTDGYDNDGDGTKDEAAPASPCSADGLNYRCHAKDAIRLGSYSTEADTTAISGTKVVKTGDQTLASGVLAFPANFTNATYYIDVRLKSSGPGLVCIDTAPLGLSPDLLTKCSVARPLTSAFEWPNIGAIGTYANAEPTSPSNGTGQRTFTLSGDQVIYVHSEGPIEIDGLYIKRNANDQPSLPTETTSSGGQVHCQVYKLSGAAPASAADSQFTNANLCPWTGFNSSTQTAPSLKLLHSATKLYGVLEVTDPAIVASTSNDDVLPSNETRIEIVFRKDTSAGPRDTDTYKVAFIGCATCGIFTAHYPNNVSTPAGWNPSITRIVDFPSGKVRYFFDIPPVFALTDGLQIRFNVMVFYEAGASDATRLACGTSSLINDPTNWCVVEMLAATVPGSADTTAPILSLFTLVNATSSSLEAKWDTDENGSCVVELDTNTGTPYAQTVTGSNSQNKKCVVPLPNLPANTNHFARGKTCDGASPPNCGFSSEDSEPTLASGATLTAGPTPAGSGNCSNSANRGLVATCLNSAVAGSIVELEDGEYAGVDSVVSPPANKGGTQQKPIIVRAKNPGQVLINGQFARIPISLCNNNDWWIIQWLRAKNGTNGVVKICGGSDNNIVEKTIGWDADPNRNASVAAINGGFANTIQDSLFFGTGRKVCSSAQSGFSNATFTRVACIYGGTNTGSGTGEMAPGPDMPATMFYNSYGMTFENGIAGWHKTLNAEQLRALITHDIQKDGASRDSDVKVLGSIAYVVNGQETSVPKLGLFFFRHNAVEIKDTLVFWDTNYATKQAASLTDCKTGNSDSLPDCSDPDLRVTNVSLIGGTGSNFIDTLWAKTNVQSGASVAAIYGAETPWEHTGPKGARICFRYEKRVLTAKPLFTTDWQTFFVTHANAAIVQAGRTVLEVTGHANGFFALFEQKFGTIPTICKQ